MRKYDEYKQQAVKKIHDGQSVASISRELGVAESLLHNWKRQLSVTSSDATQEVIILRKKLREAEMERDILKKAARNLRQKRVIRYRFIDEVKGNYPLALVCRVMRVSKSTYHAYVSGKTYMLSTVKVELSTQVKQVFWAHRRRCGSRRIAAELKAQGVRGGRFQVRSLMRRLALEAITPRRFRPLTTDSRHTVQASPNLLLDKKNAASQPAEVIVGDITYLPLSPKQVELFGKLARHIQQTNCRLGGR
ncbi:MAG: IS3 family transposase [Pyrinomonadaceae bacterium MAG19_C2-C3]|nr:IS3 family transposase [Pyrinomonadaceae bacterium MAG19_C2-C3]